MKNAVYIALSLALLTRLLSVNDYRYGHFVPPLDFPALENSAKPAPEARAPRYPAVLLFIIDGATRDSLYDPGLCPEISARWRSSGLRFENARAMKPSVSAPNYASIMTGAPAHVHGVVNNDTRSRADRHAPTVFQSLSEIGLESRVVGFDWYKQMFGRRALYIPAECCERDDPAEVARAVESMIGHNDLPFFTVAHFLSPDNAAHATGSNTGELYRSSIRTIDSLLGGIFRLLDRTLPGALVIVVSDHGMNVDGNHGGTDDASMRVPLYLLSPSLPHASVSRTVYHAAIAPTVAAAAGAALPALSAVAPLMEALDGHGAARLKESIALREHMLSAFRFMHPIIPAPKLAAPEDDIQRDARLTAAILERPERCKETLLLYQRLFFSLALLLLAAMVMRGQTPGTGTLLLVNGTVVAAAGVAMRVISSAYIHSVAVGLYAVAIAVIAALCVLLLRRGPLYLGLRIPGSFLHLFALLLLETAIIGACFLPVFTFAPDENIFGVRFFGLALWSPFILLLLIKLAVAIESRGFLVAGTVPGRDGRTA
jgi:hypothetical protein